MVTTTGAGSRIIQAAKQKLADIAVAQRAKAADANASKQAKPPTQSAATRPAAPSAQAGSAKAGSSKTLAVAQQTNGATGKRATASAASDAKIEKASAAVPSKPVAKTSAPATAAGVKSKRASGDKVDSSTGSSSSPPAKPRATRKASRITPEQALANTQKLLAAKNEQARQPQPWQTHDAELSGPADPDFQSPEAMVKATELHSGESYKSAIQGSIGTQDRHNQGKRDSR